MNPKLELIDFFADWCGPCRAMTPVLEAIAQQNPDLTVTKIDVDEQPDLAKQFRVMAIPMLVLSQGGVEVWRHSGTTTAHSVQKIIDGFSNE